MRLESHQCDCCQGVKNIDPAAINTGFADYPIKVILPSC